MEPEAEQKRRRLEVVSGGGGGGIPEDVVALILSRLPLKSLGRFKTVSKSWHQLIQSLDPFFLGLFYAIYCKTFGALHYYHPSYFYPEGIFRYIVAGGGTNGAITIDPSLSFVPIADKRVLDCCNGLLLLFQPSYSKFKYYICNPLTKSWARLRGLNWEFSRIDFNPKLSPNFKLVTFRPPVNANQSVLKIKVLSSETPAMTWKRYKPVRFRDPSADHEFYIMMIRYQHHALWEGSLYLLFGRNKVNFGEAGRIMRFHLLEEDHVADRQLIELPKGTQKPNSVGIGRSRNKLRLAGLDWIHNSNNPHLRLRVWSISKRDQTVWAMEHDSIITSSHLLSPPQANDLQEESAYIGHFHPFLDVVFILSQNIVYAYDLENLSLNEVCHVGFSGGSEADKTSIFPFLPSPVDYSIQWKTRRRET